MWTVKRSEERGKGEHGWLRSRFSFSFADYHDPKAMGFRALRVINEDRIAPSSGFPMHPHQDMEIITFLVGGTIAHEDSHGNATRIRAGEVQRMSAGSGVRHSELNPSDREETHLLQVWILPSRRGGPFSYAQKSFAPELGTGELVLTVSESGREGSISVQQDVDVYLARPRAGKRLTLSPQAGRHLWLQLVRGRVSVQGTELAAGDALYGAAEGSLAVEAREDAEFLLFDLA